MLKKTLLIFCLLLTSASANAFSLPDIDVSVPWSSSSGNSTEEQAKYLNKVKKEDLKEEYGRKKLEIHQNPFMTVEEYEMLSAPKDKALEEIPIPKPEKPSDMKYVPVYDYELVRYNNPPGSPEISLTGDFKKRRQQNAQGIVSPDYSILVYPSIYYYYKENVVACDLFVIPLEQKGNALTRIKKANVMHREPEPILSTGKVTEEYGIYRTLTPVDFNLDGTKLLVKEKIGSSSDGIWQTNAIVYDFSTHTSYKLNEIRDAIVYYWQEYKYLNLNDVRWDIYPLGFEVQNPDRIVVSAFAYTGAVPVFLGNWSIDSKGERALLLSLDPKNKVQISMNGVKMIRSGVVAPYILEKEEKHQKYVEKQEEKAREKEEKAKIKALEDEYKQKVKELDNELKIELKNDKIKEKIEGSTSTNDAVEKIDEALEKAKQKRLEKEAKAKARQLAREKKKQEKEQESLNNQQSNPTNTPEDEPAQE